MSGANVSLIWNGRTLLTMVPAPVKSNAIHRNTHTRLPNRRPRECIHIAWLDWAKPWTSPGQSGCVLPLRQRQGTFFLGVHNRTSATSPTIFSEMVSLTFTKRVMLHATTRSYAALHRVHSQHRPAMLSNWLQCRRRCGTGCCGTSPQTESLRPVEKSPLATENLLQNTDGVPPSGTPSVFSRDGTLLPSRYADARHIDDVIAF